MRTILLTIMLTPPALAFLAMLLLYVQLLYFHRALPTLSTPDDLRRFKRLAAVQMYIAFFILPIQWIPLLAWLVGIALARALGWLDLLLYVILPFAVLIAAAGLMLPLAERVRATPTPDPALEAERDHVADVWVNRSFPDW